MILVINAGSSNVKFAVYDLNNMQQLYRGQVESIQEVYSWLNANKSKYTIAGVGHRVVHGGTKFFAPVLITQTIISELKNFIPLAPLHQSFNIAAIEYIQQLNPQLVQVACFDTAFHRTQLDIAKQFAIPKEFTSAGVIRYGFHGLSYEYIASVLAEKIGDIANGKVIVAHLGNGSSMCAMENKQSVATSMGFSALEGLMMGTRCGSIDPGVVLYLLQEKGYTADKVAQFLYNDCGLLGVSKISNDVRELISSQSPDAHFALDLYCYRAACEFAKLLTPLKGCHALVFTAGIGENAAIIRKGICTWLDWMEIKLDEQANLQNSQKISTTDSKILVAVIPTDEELIIAKQVKEFIE